jgi:hypothetical protein
MAPEDSEADINYYAGHTRIRTRTYGPTHRLVPPPKGTTLIHLTDHMCHSCGTAGTHTQWPLLWPKHEALRSPGSRSSPPYARGPVSRELGYISRSERRWGTHRTRTPD